MRSILVTLYDCWQCLSCDLLFIETTLLNSYEEYALETGHPTSKLLFAELKTSITVTNVGMTFIL